MRATYTVRRSVRVAMAASAMVALAIPAAPRLAAQAGAGQSQPTAAGWVFTPAIAVAETWDNNVLLSTEDSGSTGDFLTAITPRGALSFRGPMTTFQLDYRGSYQLYQELSDLNAFDQRANASFRQRLSPKVTLFARNSLSQSPTTDEVDIPGVLFRRQGVLIDDLRAGIEARLSRRTNMTGSYTFQWVKFDEEQSEIVNLLSRSGRANGAAVEVDHVLSPRLTVGGEYETRFANVENGRQFDMQNALATVDYRLSPRYFISGGAGYSWLQTSGVTDQRSAPAFRFNLNRSGERVAWTVGYRRSFLPSVGFGGTFQNQEFQSSIIATLTRRLDLTGSFSVLEADPLATSDLGLRSIYARSSLSYLATRYLRIEGFYAASFQDTQRAGGRINRSRIGVQVVTHTRMRIR